MAGVRPSLRQVANVSPYRLLVGGPYHRIKFWSVDLPRLGAFGGKMFTKTGVEVYVGSVGHGVLVGRGELGMIVYLHIVRRTGTT